MSDDMLRSLTDTNLEWPSPPRLRYLVNVALSTVCKVWHIVRRSVVLASVNAVIHNPSSIDWLSACRLWILLALGEAYSSRCTLPDCAFPGAKYFARAMAMVHIPNERPRLALVEIYILLSIFASNLNRRHTATFMASYALRVSIILGLHIEISEVQLQDRQLREHRCRLWWTSYCFDRMWASKIGWPPSIQDQSIEIGLPSDNGLPTEAELDLHDAEHITFVVRLTQLTNNAVGSLYVRKRQPTSFSERVRTALKAVSDWANDLPPRLQLRPEDSGVPNERHVLYMHLSFNQSVIVTTRPILLHLLKQRKTDSQTDKASAPLSESALSLTTACIRCARNSLSLLKRAWTDGTIAAFDYFSTQYIFASATILALSCLLQSPGWTNDSEEFLLAVQFLQELDRNGNYAAKEYYTHIEALKVVVTDAINERTQGSSSTDTTTTFGGLSGSQVVAVPDYTTPTASDGSLQYPPLQDFLNQPAIDLDFMETGGSWLDWNDIAWPELAPMNGTL
ncbi:hypothetical protein DOTSEDRAFT_72863 [Dothistroma septosporum NZE10]|uniref:Xylanolytic transcriptional activator regulatory domain-containing protein n=1 Tax=Dothistroma septosporum (strain NZE10 / CBS 128990) TaxID=675120 RepID=M2WNP7_DOTSN|nr:hypothetical protein DOTSEDRAFT_72863 [Dothistroma septosporum NZE10]